MNTKQAGETYASHPIVAVKIAIDRWLKTNVSVSIGLIATIIAAVLIPIFIAATAYFINSETVTTSSSTYPSSAGVLGSGLLVFIALLAIALPLTIALDYTLVSSQNDKKVGYKTAAKRGYKRLLSALATYALALLLIVFGLILFIIPGIYIALRLSYLNSVIANEDLSPVESLKRAFALSKDNLWDIIGVVSVSALFTSVFSIAMTGVVALSPDSTFSVSLVAFLSVLSIVAGLLLIQALYFRYHQSALQKASELTKDSTDKLNYWLFVGAIVATTVDSSLAQSQTPDNNNFQNFNIDDYRGSV